MATKKEEQDEQEYFAKHSEEKPKTGKTDKGEKRLFQVEGEHKELTQSEAEKLGLYWKEDEPAEKD
jgi:hypothetical protein